MRTVFAVLLGLHGLIHLVGFLVPWRLAEFDGYTYKTTVAWGKLEVGDRGARAIGLCWLIACFAFLASAVGVYSDTMWAAPVLTGASLLSCGLCIAGSPAATVGVAVDLAILAELSL